MISVAKCTFKYVWLLLCIQKSGSGCLSELGLLMNYCTEGARHSGSALSSLVVVSSIASCVANSLSSLSSSVFDSSGSDRCPRRMVS